MQVYVYLYIYLNIYESSFRTTLSFYCKEKNTCQFLLNYKNFSNKTNRKLIDSKYNTSDLTIDELYLNRDPF